MLWATLEGRGYEELAWHSAFAGHRLSGEWFKWCLPIRRAIRLAQNGKDWWKRSVAEPDTDEDRLFRDMIRYSKEIEERTAA